MAGARPQGGLCDGSPSEGSEQRTAWPVFCFRGVILATLLRIDDSGASKGRETREEPTAISRQERTALDQRRMGDRLDPGHISR